MKKSLIAVSLAASLFMVGCKTASPLATPAAITRDVSVLTRIGLDVYPAAGPEVALARDVICGAAAVTNVNPAAIVRDLSMLTTTNAETKIIVDGAMFLYEQVYDAIGTNTTTKIQPYLQAVCDGLSQALPNTSLMAVNGVPRKVLLPPHWR
jgi:hypothetical protein